jgi:hypothetical protein
LKCWEGETGDRGPDPEFVNSQKGVSIRLSVDPSVMAEQVLKVFPGFGLYVTVFFKQDGLSVSHPEGPSLIHCPRSKGSRTQIQDLSKGWN